MFLNIMNQCYYLPDRMFSTYLQSNEEVALVQTMDVQFKNVILLQTNTFQVPSKTQSASSLPQL